MIQKQLSSAEMKHEFVGRFFSGESQYSLVLEYPVSQSTICRNAQKYQEDPKLKGQALAAASLFYHWNPGKKPTRARSSTHPSAASRNDSRLTVMPAIPFPPQVAALNPSFTVPQNHGVLRVKSAAELNLPGAIRLVSTGPELTAGPESTALAHHQRPAQSYVQDGQVAPRTCTSQGQTILYRPAATAGQSPLIVKETVAAAPFSATVPQPHEVLRVMSAADLNMPGAIPFGSAGQEFTAGPASTAHAPHQGPAQSYVQAGPGGPRNCTSQGPAATAGSGLPPHDQCAINSPQSCCHLPSLGVGELDKQLKERVNQRAPSPEFADDILNRLLHHAMYTIELCSYILSRSRRSELHGFNGKEVDLLILDDETWKSKSDWLDKFIESLPKALQDDRVTKIMKMLVFKATFINSLDDLKQNYTELVGLPIGLTLYLGDEHMNCPAAIESIQSLQDFEGQEMVQDSMDVDHFTDQGISGDQRTIEDQAASTLLELCNKESSLDRLIRLQKTVNNLVPKLNANSEGISGNLRPASLARFLFQGHQALASEHGSGGPGPYRGGGEMGLIK